MILAPSVAFSVGSVKLVWDPSPDTNVVSYNVYYGTSSGNYTARISVGNLTNTTVSGLADGATYFFAATSADSSGNESDYSNEISYSVPGGSTNHAPTISTIANQNTSEGLATAPVSFTIADAETPAASLSLTALSSDTTLVPVANIVFGGANGNRTVTITPAAGQVGSAQITIRVSDGTLTASTTFTLSVQSEDALPVSSLTTGTYNGLFYENDAVRVESAGSFGLAVSAGGKYSGTVLMAGGRYRIKGVFNAFCRASHVLSRKGSSPLTVSFSLTSSNSANVVSGSISDGTWSADLHVEPAAANSKFALSPYVGSYTLIIPGSDDPAHPIGNGFGSVRVAANGVVRLTGALADGTKLSQSAAVSENGAWPVFVPLYSGKGLLLGWINFTNRLSDDLNGSLSWIKLADPKSVYYANGLALESDAVGASYIPGGIVAFRPQLASLPTQTSAAPGSGTVVSFKISSGTGLFSGTVMDGSSAAPRAFRGAVLQKLNTGYGFVLGTNETSPILLTP